MEEKGSIVADWNVEEQTSVKEKVWNSDIFVPGITLYSSASRLSSMTSAVGNGFSCGLLSPLSSDILTVLPDFLPLKRINRGCRVL